MNLAQLLADIVHEGDLDLSDLEVTNDDLKLVATVPEIKILDLGDNPSLTADGLTHLSRLSDTLEGLTVFEVRIDDEGLKRIVELFPNLDSLALGGQNFTVTPEGLQVLCALEKLKNVTIIGEGYAEQVEQLLPDCYVVGNRRDEE